jgi:hypothetical protein
MKMVSTSQRPVTARYPDDALRRSVAPAVPKLAASSGLQALLPLLHVVRVVEPLADVVRGRRLVARRRLLLRRRVRPHDFHWSRGREGERMREHVSKQIRGCRWRAWCSGMAIRPSDCTHRIRLDGLRTIPQLFRWQDPLHAGRTCRAPALSSDSHSSSSLRLVLCRRLLLTFLDLLLRLGVAAGDLDQAVDRHVRSERSHHDLHDERSDASAAQSASTIPSAGAGCAFPSLVQPRADRSLARLPALTLCFFGNQCAMNFSAMTTADKGRRRYEQVDTAMAREAMDSRRRGEKRAKERRKQRRKYRSRANVISRFQSSS